MINDFTFLTTQEVMSQLCIIPNTLIYIFDKDGNPIPAKGLEYMKQEDGSLIPIIK